MGNGLNQSDKDSLPACASELRMVAVTGATGVCILTICDCALATVVVPALQPIL